MVVVYPRKMQSSLGSFSARDVMKRVVGDREIHLITLNRYRYSEQRSCKDLTDVIEQLDGKPVELVRELSHHVADEARHAMWLTDLLVNLGAKVGTPPGVSYINEFDRLLDKDTYAEQGNLEDGIIAALAAINVTEKRGCEYFSAHIYALKQAPQTEENNQIRETLERIFPEEAAHVRWGNRWLAKLADKSLEHRQKVETAKRRYAAIEQAAFEAGMDITLGAELRRVENLLDIADTMPLWERPRYFMERLPHALLAPELQLSRINLVQRAWNRDPKSLMERVIPMFLSGLNPSKQNQKKTPSGSREQ
jgi:hypothetical protein